MGECSPLVRDACVQSQVESYQRLKKWYLMPPCLILSIIRYVSKIKWSNRGKGVAPSPTLWCSSYLKGILLVTLDYGPQLYFIYSYITYILCIFICIIYVSFVNIYIYIFIYIMYICLFIYIIYIYMYIYLYILYIYVNIHIYNLYIYIYIYIMVSRKSLMRISYKYC